MRGLLALNLRRLLAHRLRLLLTVAALALAAALAVSTAGLVSSARGSVDRTVAALSGTADLEVAALAEGGFDASVLDDVRAVEGVAAAAPVVRTTVLMGGRRALLLGLDQSVVGMLPADAGLRFDGSQEGDTGDMALGRPLARSLGVGPGAAVEVVGAAGTVRASVAAVARGRLVDRVSGGRVAVVRVAQAQSISARPGRLDSVLVRASPGAELDSLAARLRGALHGRAEVSDPGAERRAAGAALDPVVEALAAMAVLALALSGFVVFNTMTVNALERRSEFAIQRAVGADRRTLLRRFLVEAAAVGAAGALPGAAIGWATVRALIDGLPAGVRSMLGAPLEFVVPVWVPALAAAGVVVVAVAASYPPARRAAAVPPAEAFRTGALAAAPASSPPTRLVRWTGAVLLACGAAVGLTSGGALASAAAGAVVVGAVAMAYGGTGRLAAVGGGLAAPLGPSGRLAADALRRAPRRMWATTAAVMLALAATVAVGEASANVGDSASATFAPLRGIDLIVQTAPADDVPMSVPVPAAAAEAMARIPGVAAVVPGRQGFAFFGGRRVLLHAAGPETHTAMLRLAGPAAVRRLTAGDAVVLSTQLADSLDVERGGHFMLPTVDGPRRVEVAAVVPSLLWPSGVIGLEYRDLVDWFGMPGPTWYEVVLEPGARPADVRRAVLGIRSPVPLYAYDGPEIVAAGDRNVAQVQALLAAFQWVVVVAAGLAILNTLMISLFERSRELAMMRAVGLSNRTLVGMIAAETGAMVAVGTGLGAALGLLEHRILVVVSQAAGYPTTYAVEAGPLVVALAGAALMALAGAGVAARRAGRADIVRAIAYE